MVRLLGIVAIAMASLFGAACSDGGDAAESRDQFIRDAEAEIEQLRTRAGELRDDIATGEAAEDVKAEADRLDEHIADAEAKLDEVRSAGEDEWQALKSEFDGVIGSAENLAEEIGGELGIP